MEAGGIALAIPGDCNNPLCDDLTHLLSRPEILKRFARLVESLAHRRGAASSNQMFGWEGFPSGKVVAVPYRPLFVLLPV